MSDLKPLSAEELNRIQKWRPLLLAPDVDRLIAQARRALELETIADERAGQYISLVRNYDDAGDKIITLQSENADLKAQVGFLKTQLNMFENSDAMTEITKLSAALDAAEKALENMKNANPNPDLSTQKYRDAWKFLDDLADKSLVAIRKHRGEK